MRARACVCVRVYACELAFPSPVVPVCAVLGRWPRQNEFRQLIVETRFGQNEFRQLIVETRFAGASGPKPRKRAVRFTLR